MIRHQPLTFESLERRNMLTGVMVEGGALTVVGTKLADNIQVQTSGNNVIVKLNGEQTIMPSWMVISSTILIDGLAGDDQITIADGVTLRATIHGGPGNDTIHGGELNDFLFGDAGNDTIFGKDGADTISGGAGNDALNGDA